MAVIVNGILKKVEASDIINGIYITPPEVRVIAPYAFEDRSELKELRLGASVIGLGQHLFTKSDSNLQTVVATNNLLVIGEGAFEYCELLNSFLIGETTAEESKPFYCTGSEFIGLFGYYEKATENYNLIRSVEKDFSNIDDYDWYEANNLKATYPLYAGIYHRAFNGFPNQSFRGYCPRKVFQIPNKMQIIGTSNFVFSDEKLRNNQTISNIIRIFEYDNDYKDVKYNKIKRMIRANAIRISHNIRKLKTSQVPENGKVDRNSPLSKKEQSNVQIYSVERYKNVIASKLALLETINPDISAYFMKKFQEVLLFQNPVNLHVELSKLYDALVIACTLIQIKTLLESYENNDIEKNQIEEYRQTILTLRKQILFGLFSFYVKEEKVKSQIKSELYAAIYLLVKFELSINNSAELFKSMEEEDLFSLFRLFAEDVRKKAKHLSKMYLDDEKLSIDMLINFLEATTGNKITLYTELEETTPKILIRVSFSGPTTLKNGLPVLEEFQTVTNKR